ncbi:hypothetical protein DV738_g1861, partial [Chaetothyriales sp. CBS 135597]
MAGTEEQQQKGGAETSLQSRGPSPNRGASVPDFTAIGPDSESKQAWREARGIDRSKQVKITKVSHMRYQHPDLQVITTFLKDFGLSVVKKTDTERWFGGYGPDPYVYYARQGPRKYLGGTFEVESVAELEKIINSVPGLTVTSNGIEELTTAPGGGKFLSITDPEGFPVNFITGQSVGTTTSGQQLKKQPPEKLVVNYETDKPRQRAFLRFDPGPAAVYKLGHFGLNVQDFPAQMDWYTRHFNISPSDILYVPTGDGGRKEVAVFAHIDRGQELVDHHTMFLTTLSPGVEKHVHHASFEVHDFDTQALGHQWLEQKGYKPVWGM